MRTVFENTLMQHHVALPLDAMEKITYIAPPDTVLELEFQGVKKQITMLQDMGCCNTYFNGYAGSTIAEYFRDMGYNVSMTADSTSRWAEALREISGWLAADSGYPAYLAARLASFYERAGKVKCLGGPKCTVLFRFSGILTRNLLRGSISLLSIGLSHTQSTQGHALEYFYEKFDPDFISIRTKAREVLQREDDLNEIVQLVGKDALAETDKITLETAKLLREDYLAQNAFTPSQKFEDPAEGEEALISKFKKLNEDLTAGFRALEDETRRTEVEKIRLFPLS
ncbi:hypothetical protein V6N13_023451 [Hibiscus sabdariffa]